MSRSCVPNYVSGGGDPARMVVVTSESGEKFLGFIPKAVDGEVYEPNDYMYYACVNEGVAVLFEARQLVEQRQLRMMPPTEPGSIGRYAGSESFTILLPIGLSKGPMTIYIRVASWFMPGGNEFLSEAYAKMIRQAEDNEKLSAAAEVLTIPGVNDKVGMRQ